MMEDRREGSGSPPTVIMQAFREMDADDKNKMERVGYGMITLVGAVVAAGIFYDMAISYLIFVGCFGLVGVCLIFPVLGAYVMDLVAKVTISVAPSLRPRLTIDKRGASSEESEAE